jgi:hypothetical protein
MSKPNLKFVEDDAPRTWEALVEAGRSAAEAETATQWTLGDLALEVEPMAAHGVNTGSLSRLQDYADEIGVSFDSLRKYRQVAATWTDGRRIPSLSFSAHAAAVSYPWILENLYADSSDGRVTVREVQEALPTKPEPIVYPPTEELTWWRMFVKTFRRTLADNAHLDDPRGLQLTVNDVLDEGEHASGDLRLIYLNRLRQILDDAEAAILAEIREEEA